MPTVLPTTALTISSMGQAVEAECASVSQSGESLATPISGVVLAGSLPQDPALEDLAAARLSAPSFESAFFEAPVPLPRRPLKELLPHAESALGLTAMEEFLRAPEGGRDDLVAPTLSRLKKVRERLVRGDFSGDERDDVAGYLRLIDDLRAGPSSDFVLAALGAMVRLNEPAVETFESLSYVAQRGVYAVARALPERQRRNVVRLLTNRNFDYLRDFKLADILETAAHLEDRRVAGFHLAFVPHLIRGNLVDEKFLTTDNRQISRITSLYAEYREALHIAHHQSVVSVAHDEDMDIDWGRLAPKEDRYIRQFIEPHMSFPFRDQRHSSADILYTLVNGKRRLVEVKSACRYLEFNDHCTQAKELLQVIRHALVARQHGLEGIEYVLCAPRVGNFWLAKVYEILWELGVPYVVSMRASRQSELRVLKSWGMKPLPAEKAVSSDFRHPFYL